MCVWLVTENNERAKFTVKASHTALPSDIVADTIRRRSRSMGFTKEDAERCVEESGHLYVLKVCGSDSFFLAEVSISQYRVSLSPTPMLHWTPRTVRQFGVFCADRSVRLCLVSGVSALLFISVNPAYYPPALPEILSILYCFKPFSDTGIASRHL